MPNQPRALVMFASDLFRLAFEVDGDLARRLVPERILFKAGRNPIR